MRVLAGLLCTVTLACTVKANVEKTVFRGPGDLLLPHVHPRLDALRLGSLSHAHPVLPTQLPAHFPSRAAPRGLESWYLLQRLEAARRYEVRICWPATQPTDFWLDTFTVRDVFDTPGLVKSLTQYSEHHQQFHLSESEHYEPAQSATAQSVLLLRIQAAASYYSTNRTLMEHPEPVDVDITNAPVLDPFLLNILPQSLAPFAAYFTVVAIGAWFLSGYIFHWIDSVASEPLLKPHSD
ncbi:hypothetical protein BDU57DRAFT_594133 [Ampelomyces quisqualis]|uniref:Uncharacterized protein n=1 Tax=Ampelomyces quisqualis TaxID=50730 RepID=A0A6A5QTF1_AMPQU|nr:hypothetical protein BDU57DRAFT_594133 [Ampelomyces quisqualis]